MRCKQCAFYEKHPMGKGFCKAPGSLDKITEKLYPNGIPKTADTLVCGMMKTKRQLKKEGRSNEGAKKKKE